MASTGPLTYSLTLGRTSLDQHDVTVLHRVVLALGHHLTLGLDRGMANKIHVIRLVGYNAGVFVTGYIYRVVGERRLGVAESGVACGLDVCKMILLVDALTQSRVAYLENSKYNHPSPLSRPRQSLL